MTAHDVRQLRVCSRCSSLGDGRRMLKVKGWLFHDACAIAELSHADLLGLPEQELDKITIGAAGGDLMRELIAQRIKLQLAAEHVLALMKRKKGAA